MFGILVAEYALTRSRRRWSAPATPTRTSIGDAEILLPRPAEIRRRRRRWRSRLPMRITARARRCGSGGRAMIGKLKGMIDSYGEAMSSPTPTGVGYIRCIARRGRCRRYRRRARLRCCRSRRMCAGPDQLFGFAARRARMVPAARTVQASAPRWRWRCSRRCRRGSPMRSLRDKARGDADASVGPKSPSASSPN